MKLKPSDETETFISEAGYYVIKQCTAMGEDSVVCLTASQVALVIEDMRKCMDDLSWQSENSEV